MTSLLDIVKAHSPDIQANGQIRMQCPFRENHEGKYAAASGDGSKSFFISPDINAYHCFSCKEKGKATVLLQKRFGIPYFTAIEYVTLTETLIKERKEFELMIHWKIVPPKELIERGFSAETLKHFKLGYSKKEIIIPLFMNKKLVGIKYRSLDRSSTYPFWYSDGFHKEIYLYNYDLERSIKNGYTIIVEGETDTFRLFDYGYDVTSTLGTSLSDEHVEMLSKIPKIYMAYDSDNPGITGMHKAYNKLKRLTDVEFINYLAKDPADSTKRNFAYGFKHACNYGEFKILTEE